MSEQASAAPAAPATSAVTPTDTSAIAKQVKKLREAFGDMTLEKFKGRLEEERQAGTRAALKALGVPKEQRDEYLAKLGEYQLVPKPKDGKGYDDLVKAAGEAEALRAKVEKHQGYFKQVADEAFAKLPEVAQKELARRGIKDHEAILDEIAAMKTSGLLDALAGTKSVEAQKSTTTANAPGPKKAEPSTGDANDAFAKYEELKKTNRLAAARFRQVYGHAIEQAIAARQK